MNLIDRDELFQKAISIIKDKMGDKEFGILSEIMIAETVEAEPVKHSKWEPITNGLWGWRCSSCGKEVYSNRKCDVDRYKYPYCPNCGAKMDGDNEKELPT